jgi:16S rRNA (guanine966-N2)-methyltransferase
MFDALVARMGTFDGAAVLDVFAGTGALGLEALSRGAACAVFVESGRAALIALRGNIESLGAGDACAVVEGDAGSRALDRALAHGPFALLLLDPPYRIDGSIPVSVVERASGALAPDALVVWEHSSAVEPPEPDGWARARTYRYGDTAVSVFVRSDGGEP